MHLNLRVIVLALFALGAATTTVLFARNWINAQRAAYNTEAPAPAPETTGVEVLVAKESLPAGTFVKPGHLRWQVWPDDNLAPSYVVKDEDERGTDDFIGAVVRKGVPLGQPLTDAMVVKPGERGFLAAVLDPGKRAVSIATNATTGISGFVFPGDRVDLILTHAIREESDDQSNTTTRRASETVLSNLRVLAVDQSTNDQEGEPQLAKTVTLEVTPKQVEIISVAGELGKLSLSLRALARKDAKKGQRATTVGRRTFTWDNQASLLITPPAAPRVAPSRAVNVVRGGKAETQDFRRTQ